MALPSRTKISFLFDIKKAAEIDDQTLFYMCQSGIKALESKVDLSTFQSDLFGERSLSFNRGLKTKEELEPVDEKLRLVLKLLAPFSIDQSAHKVLEYLIRVYDVHVFHKELLLLSFLPHFDTAFFLKMVQCLSL